MLGAGRRILHEEIRRMKRPASRSGWRWLLPVIAVVTLVVAAASCEPTPAAAATCSVTYTASPWTESPGVGGFTANLTVTNLGAPISGWTLSFALPAGQSLTQGWSATWSNGPPVTATNLSWNADLGTGGSTQIGFNGRWTGAYSSPVAFTLNGAACATGPATTTTTTPGSTTTTTGSTTTTSTPTTSTTPPSSTTTTTTPPAGAKADNPFAGATGYVNPAWQAQVNSDAAAAGGTLGAQMLVVGRQPTAVWMDRIAALDPPGTAMGLADHLDAAVQQDAANGAAPLTLEVVVYDLPNRDCAALASNGELLIANGGLARYRTEYIDPMRAILADEAYRNLRIVLIIEPDSLPNLVTNTTGAQASQRCIEAEQTGTYRDGVRYAVSRLSSLPNTYLYVDLAHSGWLGWPNNFNGALGVFDGVFAAGQGGPGYDKIHGFVTNTANYTPIDEPFLPNPNLQVGNGQVLSSTFYEFNPNFDERDYAVAFQQAFAARGCAGCGMLVDTSRNGWGGAGRPTQASTSTDLNTYVDQSRVDRRPHRGGWCNQSGAGIGLRPTASTGTAGIDAYVWIKPPGESDGISQAGISDPDDPAKGFDAMCDPNARNRYNSAFPTNALPGAPHAGRWFAAQFRMLVQNAFPALPTS
jgi:cellulose 1,4-beta-cellobiosidase